MRAGRFPALGAPVSVEDLALSMYDEMTLERDRLRDEIKVAYIAVENLRKERTEAWTESAQLRAELAEARAQLGFTLAPRYAQLAERDERIAVLEGALGRVRTAINNGHPYFVTNPAETTLDFLDAALAKAKP